MPRFAVNCSILFTDAPFLTRFQRARVAGFAAVECWWPTGFDHDTFVTAVEQAGVQLVLLNLDGGDLAAGERGFLTDPDAGSRIRANFDVALRIASRLGRPYLHALVGNWRPDEPREAQRERVYQWLRWMAPLAANAGVTLLLEAMNGFDAPAYPLRRVSDVLAVLDAVAAPNVKYQCDLYHLQRTEGNLIETLRANLDRIAHIQIADVPGRHEPGTGEIHYQRVLGALDELGYPGYVALEYHARGMVEESFHWLPADRRAFVPASALSL